MTAPAPFRRFPVPARPSLAGLLALAALATGPAGAQALRYTLDPVHTRVLFSVSHAGFSQALGTVSGSQGSLEFDPQDWTGARLEVSVPLQQLDLGDADWNRAVLGPRLLDAGRWPQARFVSTRVEVLGPDRLRVHGQLTLRGVTRELPLEVNVNALKRHPLPPFRRTAGFSASTRLSRADFGIDAWPTSIGDQVELRIEAEAVRAARTPAPPAGDAVPTPPAGETAADADADADADTDTTPTPPIPPEPATP